MIFGFVVGLLFAALYCAVITAVNVFANLDKCFTKLDFKTNKTYLTKYGKINITIAILILCLSTFIGARVHIREFENEIIQFEAAKVCYSEAIKSEAISGLERIEIVNKITEENKNLAKLKYDATKWYYFYLPDSLVDNLEPIKLN